MLKEITHTGITVSDLGRSVEFYKEVLGLEYVGHARMEGPETEALFGRRMIAVEIAYLKPKDAPDSALIELMEIQGTITEKIPMSLFRTGISELCFMTDDIRGDTERLMEQGVDFISAPQDFNFKAFGFRESRAVYFRDPDGTIIELMQYVTSPR